MVKRPNSIVGRLEKAAGDVIDAVSVAATGSQVGVLELAAEDDLGIKPVKQRRKPVAAKKKAAAKKKVAAKKVVVKKVAKKAAKKSKTKAKRR